MVHIKKEKKSLKKKKKKAILWAAKRIKSYNTE